MKRLLLLLVMALMAAPILRAQESTEITQFFEFSPASINEYADENGDIWYLMPDRQARFLYDSGNNTLLTKVALNADNLDAFLWKFVESEDGAFQIVSKAGNKIAYTSTNLSTTITARSFYLSRNSTNTFEYEENPEYEGNMLLYCVEAKRYFYSDDTKTFYGKAKPIEEESTEEEMIVFYFYSAITTRLLENQSLPYKLKTSTDSQSHWYQIRLFSSKKDDNGDLAYYFVQDNGAGVLPTGALSDLTNDGQFWKAVANSTGSNTLTFESKKGNVLTFDASLDETSSENRRKMFGIKAKSSASASESALIFAGKTDSTAAISFNTGKQYRFLSHDYNEQEVIMAHDSVGGSLGIIDLYSINTQALNPAGSRYVYSQYLRFGEVLKGQTSEAKDLRITKYLTGDLSYTLTGDASAFSISEDNYTAENGGDLSIRFTPADANKLYKAVITFKSAGADDVSVTLSGVGLGDVSSIPEIDTTDDPVVETTYYTIQGQQITAPIYGINIVKMKHESGKISAIKIFHQQ